MDPTAAAKTPPAPRASRRQRLAAALRRLNARAKQTDQVYVVAVAAVIGVATGAVAVGFHHLIDLVALAFWGGPLTAELAASRSLWWRVAAPALGGLCACHVVRRFAAAARGHGVPEVMAAVAQRGGRMPASVAPTKAVASALTLGSGGSAGAEGPIVQVGAGVGSVIGQWLRVGPRRLRTFVGCGVAAGIAATFNAPVAGALFAVEVILGDIGVPQFSPIVVSSVLATVLSRQVLSDRPVFVAPGYEVVSYGELAVYVALGVVAGLVGILFIRLMALCEGAFERVRLPPEARAALGGALVGAIGLGVPRALGVGYDTIGAALHLGRLTGLDGGAAGLGAVLAGLGLLLGAKLLAVCLTLSSGGSGGIFAPSLCLGAVTGALVGAAAQAVAPGSVAPPGAYALVGMSAVLAATTHAPITAIMIVFELTNDYRIMLPLLTATTIASLLSWRLEPLSLYTAKLARQGIDLRGGSDVNVLRSVPITEVLRRDHLVVRPEAPLTEVLRQTVAQGGHAYVVGVDGRLHGALTARELGPLLPQGDALDAVVAADVCDPHAPRVRADAHLDEAMRRLGGGIRDELAVIDDGRLVGVVTLADVVARYNRELFRHEAAAHVARSLGPREPGEPVASVAGYQVAEVDVPDDLDGRTLTEADVRGRFGVTVLLIRGKAEGGGEEVTPAQPDAVLRAGQRLVVFGDRASVEAFRRA